MPVELKKSDIIQVLREVQADTSLRKFAGEIGCTAAYLCEVYKGKRDPGPLILDYLGIEKKTETKTTYRWR